MLLFSTPPDCFLLLTNLSVSSHSSYCSELTGWELTMSHGLIMEITSANRIKGVLKIIQSHNIQEKKTSLVFIVPPLPLSSKRIKYRCIIEPVAACLWKQNVTAHFLFTVKVLCLQPQVCGWTQIQEDLEIMQHKRSPVSVSL